MLSSLMNLTLFRLLEMVLRSYAKQPARLLLDSRLRLRLLLRITHPMFQSLTKTINLSSPEYAILTTKTKSKGKHLACLIIDHPLLLPLGKLILEQEEVLIIGQNGNCSNVVGIPIGDQTLPTFALVFRMGDEGLEEVYEQLQAYLSICEVFLGHLHLTFSCRESEPTLDWQEELSASEGDQYADFKEEGYFRVLQERAGKVTLQELSQGFRVQRRHWGEVFVSEGGREGLVVWVTLGRLPLLGKPPVLRLGRKGAVKLTLMIESPLGFAVFKRKELLRADLQELQTTTVILNLREDSEIARVEMEEIFQLEVAQFLSKGCLEIEKGHLKETLCLCERVGELLGMSSDVLVKKLLSS